MAPCTARFVLVGLTLAPSAPAQADAPLVARPDERATGDVLLLAVGRGQVESARALLELGADAYVFDGDGLGPTDRRRWALEVRRGQAAVDDDGLIELVESRWPTR